MHTCTNEIESRFKNFINFIFDNELDSIEGYSLGIVKRVRYALNSTICIMPIYFTIKYAITYVLNVRCTLYSIL